MKALGLGTLLALLCVCLGSRGVTAQTASEDALAQSLNDALSKGDGAQGLKLAGQLVAELEKRADTDSVQLIPALPWLAYFRARAGDVGGATGDISRSYS